MALAQDLMGLGDSGPHATLAGHNVTTSTAGTGTAQIGATAIGTSIFLGNSTSGKTAYTLPSASTAVGVAMAKEVYFFNVGDTTALIFAPLGGATLNGSASSSISVSANTGAMFMCVAGAGGSAPQWTGIVSA